MKHVLRIPADCPESTIPNDAPKKELPVNNSIQSTYDDIISFLYGISVAPQL